jgi:hypothetical protein
MINIVFEAA